MNKFDKEDADQVDDLVLANSRRSMWIEMEMLADYIRIIRDKSQMLGEVL